MWLTLDYSTLFLVEHLQPNNTIVIWRWDVAGPNNRIGLKNASEPWRGYLGNGVVIVTMNATTWPAVKEDFVVRALVVEPRSGDLYVGAGEEGVVVYANAGKFAVESGVRVRGRVHVEFRVRCLDVDNDGQWVFLGEEGGGRGRWEDGDFGY
ncbi:hypothetical protein BC829DRAFT_26842 [Chytridium lagenaria]|nr:hypothetical protein BC829DRAFT_26842 [Chytridium lagenaria]